MNECLSVRLSPAKQQKLTHDSHTTHTTAQHPKNTITTIQSNHGRRHTTTNTNSKNMLTRSSSVSAVL